MVPHPLACLALLGRSGQAPCGALRDRVGILTLNYPITVTIEVAGMVIVNEPPFTGIAVSGA
jgi:hypothetical protein